MNFTQFLTWPGATVIPFESELDGRRHAWLVRLSDVYKGAGYSRVANSFRGLQDSQFAILFHNQRMVSVDE